MKTVRVAGVCVALGLAACAVDPGPDAGGPDAGDAVGADAGASGGGTADAGRPDASVERGDAGLVDAGLVDAGDVDAGSVDAGLGADGGLRALRPLNLGVAGSRLSPMVFVADGEVVGPAGGFFDQQLQTECTSQRVLDAGVRCLPSRGLQTVAPMYADPTCRGAVVAYDPAPNCGSARFLTVAFDECGDDAVYAIGPPVPVSTPLYAASGSQCFPVGTAGLNPLVVALTPVDPSRFAEFQALPPQVLTASFSAEVEVATDGARRAARLVDRSNGVLCTPTAFPDGGVRCLPSTASAVLATTFSDAQCRQQAARGARGCAREPFARRPASCEPLPRYYTVGAALSATYEERAGQCLMLPAQGGLYALGNEVDLAGFPSGAPVRVGTAARVRGLGLELFDGGVWAAPVFIDVRTGAACTPTLMTDGLLRCLPSPQATVLSGLFGDSACTGPAQVGTLRCGADAGFATQADLSFCEARFSVFEIDAPWDGGVYRRAPLPDGGATCQLQSGLGPLFSLRRVDPATFVEMTRAPVP